MELVCGYMKEDSLRHQLNALTKKTFGFDFENWVSGGYFEGDYIPYSFLEDGKIIANASANKMHFIQNGVRRNYIQIGTVMTDEAYRNQGLARRLVEHILKEYGSSWDGIYLFGDLGALDFYRKIGFLEGLQYQPILKTLPSEKTGNEISFQKVGKQDEQLKIKYMDTVRNSAVNSAFEQINKYGLQMFYTADFSNVYYAKDIGCFAVMDREGDALILQSIVSKEHLSLKEIIPRIDIKYRSLKLGFSPCAKDADMFGTFAYDGRDDYRLFYQGSSLESIQTERLFFPLLSHA